MILGVDVSSYLEELELNNTVFYDQKHNVVDPFLRFKENGVDLIRLRIWNAPYAENGKPYLAGTCDTDRMLKLAKMLQKYNFSFMVDFHYSDFWADPAKQFIPKAWEGLSVSEMAEKLYLFTLETLKKFKEANIDVTHIQIGNEITNGMLWPIARIDYSNVDEKNIDNLVTFLRRGKDACKEVFPNAKTIVHLEESYNIKKYDFYLNSLKKRGFIFDILGSSYYPLWHHSMDEYFACQDFVRNKYHIDVMNVEVGYPFTLDDYAEVPDSNLVINSNTEGVNEKFVYGITQEGQKQFIKELIYKAKKHNLKGICYWEPLWIKGDKIKFISEEAQVYQNTYFKQTRNEWANQTLINYDNTLTLGFDEYKND